MPQPSIADVQTPDQFATSLPEQTKRAFREHQVYWRSLGRRSQRGEALDGDAAAAAVSARAAIARGKLRLPP